MYVYILRSINYPDETYVGVTHNVERRLKEHNLGRSSYTYRLRPWRVEPTIWFSNFEKALAFEDYLKSGSGRAFRNTHF
jgi:putative endonuclease